MSFAQKLDHRSPAAKLRAHWGFALLCAFSLLSLVRLLTQKVPGHYRIFTGAGRALWHSQNPYGTDYGTGVGLYFYSPTCALTVFGPLSLLPEKLGMIVYMAASWAILIWGVRLFWQNVVLETGERGSKQAASLQWFWAAITAQLVGGILASKLEIAITGFLLASIAELHRSAPRLNRRGWAAAITLAAILNWKFQPLPVIGLLLLSRLILWRDWKLPVGIAVALTAWYALPFVFFPHELLTRMHQTWQSTFSAFVAGSVLNFENVFAFLHGAFAWELSFPATQAISGFVGVCLAAFTSIWVFKARPLKRAQGATLLSVALGTMFMTAFSPLGQNNALILYAPLLLCAFACLQQSAHRNGWIGLLTGTTAVMVLAYSDAVPPRLREALRHLSVKPLVCLILGLAVAKQLWDTHTRLIKENIE